MKVSDQQHGLFWTENNQMRLQPLGINKADKDNKNIFHKKKSLNVAPIHLNHITDLRESAASLNYWRMT